MGVSIANEVGLTISSFKRFGWLGLVALFLLRLHSMTPAITAATTSTAAMLTPAIIPGSEAPAFPLPRELLPPPCRSEGGGGLPDADGVRADGLADSLGVGVELGVEETVGETEEVGVEVAVLDVLGVGVTLLEALGVGDGVGAQVVATQACVRVDGSG